MDTVPDTDADVPRERAPWSRAETTYAASLFVVAIAVVSFAAARSGEPPQTYGAGTAVFFLLYGLFTISIGYQHPRFGYYSFDRVSQVASILVLGPLGAAWVNGLASFIYPWHRLWGGTPLRHVVYAALHNAGLMSLIILFSGYIYTLLGGRVPLDTMTSASIVPLVVVVLSMQLLNDVGMLGLLKLAGRSMSGFFSKFSYALELGSGATAVLVALVYNGMERGTLILLLGVLSLGMLALRQFANMRLELEHIVAQRTESLREKTRALELLATQDNLTGLFNRRYADEYLERQVEHVRRYGQPLSVALADVDSFKQINDMHSHATGDEVLRRVADILHARCRSTDMLARYGGEEFLICFPQTSLQQARVLCEELRAAVEAGDWAALGLRGSVTLSFGIAELGPDCSPAAALGDADRRLYAAKHDGRNRVSA